MTLIDSRLSHRTQQNNPIMVPKLIVFLAICLAVHSFSPPHSKIQTQLHAQPDDGPVFYNDFEDSGFSTDDLDLSHMLKQRSMELNREERRILKNWRYGKANSFKAFTINEGYLLDKEEDLPFDWVRRVDIGQYPRVACGSAHGSIFVADVNAKKILAEARGVHFSQHSDDHVNCLDEQLRQHIYGDYDGGGVLDVSMFGKRLVASAGREGGVKIFRLLENNRELKYEGDIQAFIRKMPGALPVIATCMKFDLAGRLYVGSSDGLLRIVTFPNSFIASDAALDPNEIQVAVIPMCERQQSPILALDISEDLGMVATAHASGDASVHSIIEQENGTWKTEVAGIWKAIAGSCARSISFVSWVRGSRHGVVVGGGNGELWVSDIDTEPTEKSLFVKDGAQKIEPNHQGPIISLVSRPGGIIASVSHDGQLRVTHAWLGRKGSRPLYGIVGLKVWVGSVCIDEEGKRLVSDGFDDVVVVHDFDPEDL